MAVEIKPPLILAQAILSSTGRWCAFEDLPRQVYNLKKQNLHAIFFQSRSVVLLLDYTLSSFQVDFDWLVGFDIEIDEADNLDPKLLSCSLLGDWKIHLHTEDKGTLLHSYPTDIVGLLSLSCSCVHVKQELDKMFLASMVIEEQVCSCIVPGILKLMFELVMTEIEKSKCSGYTRDIPRVPLW